MPRCTRRPRRRHTRPSARAPRPATALPPRACPGAPADHGEGTLALEPGHLGRLPPDNRDAEHAAGLRRSPDRRRYRPPGEPPPPDLAEKEERPGPAARWRGGARAWGSSLPVPT